MLSEYYHACMILSYKSYVVAAVFSGALVHGQACTPSTAAATPLTYVGTSSVFTTQSGEDSY